MVLAVATDQPDFEFGRLHARRSARYRPPVKRFAEGAAAFGEAVTLAHFHAGNGALDLIHQFVRHHRRSYGQPLEAGQVELGQFVAVLQEHGEDGGNAARVGAAVFGQRVEVGERFVGGHQHKGRPGVEHGLHRAAHRILVEQRQCDEAAVFGLGRPVTLVVMYVPEHARVGHDRALGQAG